MTSHKSDVIPLDAAKHLPGLFQERVRRSPDSVAYHYFDEVAQQWRDLSWHDMAARVALWRTALAAETIKAGDRVAIMLRNWPQWVIYEQAALSLGLVVVPLYTNDRAANLGYIIENAGIRLVLIDGEEHWNVLSEVYPQLEGVQRIVALQTINNAHDIRIRSLPDWLPAAADEQLALPEIDPHSLATIVYTSGTTGNPKGVMLSHYNILWNAASAANCEAFFTDDVFLSFLPLSHMFERTAGYYMPMITGSRVTYARSIELLAEDLMLIRPTILVTVPRIFERVFNKIKAQLEEKPRLASKLFQLTVTTGWARFLHRQGRGGWSICFLLWPLLNKLVAAKIMAKLGGRMRLAVCGGAPLSPEIAKTFIGLGLSITQGYGMTELSPIVSTNLLLDNKPESVGQPLPGVEVKLGTSNELLVRSPGVMLGYWGNLEATQQTIDDDGWVHTGDVARLDGDHVYITGRLKEIIVLANGEKIPPADLELAIATDPMFEQVLIIGEGKPFLSALVVLNSNNWRKLADNLGLAVDDENNIQDTRVQTEFLERIKLKLKYFPGYARIYRVIATLQPWTVEMGLITPTLKLKRNKLIDHYSNVIVETYEGH